MYIILFVKKVMPNGYLLIQKACILKTKCAIYCDCHAKEIYFHHHNSHLGLRGPGAVNNHIQASVHIGEQQQPAHERVQTSRMVHLCVA